MNGERGRGKKVLSATGDTLYAAAKQAGQCGWQGKSRRVDE